MVNTALYNNVSVKVISRGPASINVKSDIHFRFNFLLERREGHNLRIDLFDEDSFSRDDYLGKAVVNIEDCIANHTDDGDDGISMCLEDDPHENSSKKPSPISGDVIIQLR